ncbi:MAG TPA: PfkB family carbohydrate kinase [Acidimicrobiales bacterium]|nr:PfkB family carbohydrate kinase [Acidimicrobiales bacterium]
MVVIGDVMLDVVVRPVAVLAPTSDTASRIRVGRGGSAASVALAIARSGHDVCFLGAAGRDGSAALVRDALEQGGVRVDLEYVDAPTGTVVSLVGDDGRRGMLTDRGANSQLSETFVLEALARPFEHLHLSGYLLLDPFTRAVAASALACAANQGATTSLDVCSLVPLLALTPSVFLASATGATYLFANEEESLALSDTDDVTSALDVLAASFDEVVITRGARGALAARGEHRESASALNVVALDTTGAGDAATGAYLGARLNQESIQVALRAAMEAGARAVETLGAN